MGKPYATCKFDGKKLGSSTAAITKYLGLPVGTLLYKDEGSAVYFTTIDPELDKETCKCLEGYKPY
ncbi:hypothetical protein H4R18_003349 [Coemansia javaensis]|uniref:Uncharacterized protein n=1 Tax=Coemansia javaensis TaxID=2761396 RepID=A0A9W8H889_9FUNG|nr:hypothetical protein H4R18_003349 [Coemansia javaensis]